MTQNEKGYWKQFAKAALIRAARTWAQTFVATIPVTGVLLEDINWLMCASSATVAAIASILTSLATKLPEVPMPDEMVAKQYGTSDAMIEEDHHE